MAKKKNSVLIIAGVHQEEYQFGLKVVERLDHDLLDKLLIPKGISHQNNGVSEAHYRRQHEEMYQQIKAHIKKRHSLVIDLHAGQNESFGIDLFSHQAKRYPCLQPDQILSSFPEIQLRVIDIKDNLRQRKGIFLTSYTLLPKKIWKNKSFVYIGMEVYCRDNRYNTLAEITQSAEVITSLIQCHSILQNR